MGHTVNRVVQVASVSPLLVLMTISTVLLFTVPPPGAEPRNVQLEEVDFRVWLDLRRGGGKGRDGRSVDTGREGYVVSA